MDVGFRRFRLTALLFAVCLFLSRAGRAETPPASLPIALGVDDAGSYLTSVGIDYWTHPPYFEALRELGVGMLSIHSHPPSPDGTDLSPKFAARLASIDRAMREHGLAYLLNVELPNFKTSLEITPGVNEFAHPGGLHRWDLRMEWLDPLLPPRSAGVPALRGVIYDEVDYMQLASAKYSNGAREDFDAPFLVNTDGMPLETAYERLVEACRSLRIDHYQNRIRLQTEQVWPDLYHIFARAGWTVAPKLLKEGLSSPYLCIALGAAVQYQREGANFWVSPDLWNRHSYPGHSPQALRSAMMMGYELGAEGIYVENFDSMLKAPRHPLAGPSGSLIAWSDPEHFTVTPYGEVVRDFYRKYVPSHPRWTDWRDYDPRVAIIRLPDGGWGQYSTGPGYAEASSRNRLLGNREMPLDEAASEWLKIWPILTHGVVREGALSSQNHFVYPKGIEKFFVPIDSVAVFDHRVEADRLRNVDCMIVCGHALSRPTFEAVRDRVANGATCIIARRLYDKYAKGALPGDWLVVDDFKDPAIAEKLEPFLGPPDLARFRFKNCLVEFRSGTVDDSIEVLIRERPPSAN